jgi:hypothetical protein
LDGCCDHRAIIADEALHRHAVENLNRADALLLGRVTYEMMEPAFRPAWTGEMPEWMEPFRRTIDAAKKYVVSRTLNRVDWNAELVHGDLEKAVQQLKQESGKGLSMLSFFQNHDEDLPTMRRCPASRPFCRRQREHGNSSR